MNRTTVMIPDDLAALLEHERRRRAVPIAEIVREALVAYLAGAPAERRQLPFVALGRSGHHDTAARVEAILEREWVPDRRR